MAEHQRILKCRQAIDIIGALMIANIAALEWLGIAAREISEGSCLMGKGVQDGCDGLDFFLGEGREVGHGGKVTDGGGDPRGRAERLVGAGKGMVAGCAVGAVERCPVRAALFTGEERQGGRKEKQADNKQCDGSHGLPEEKDRSLCRRRASHSLESCPPF